MSDFSDDVIGYVDMDAFEVQLYQNKSYPEYRGQPCIVADRTGRIVSVSHEAKTFGISRNIRADEALEFCRNLKVITKPERWNKPDALTTRHGSWAVLDALKQFFNSGRDVVVEYSSNDGFFIDMTEEVNGRVKDLDRVQIGENVFVEQGGVPTDRTTFFRGQTNKELYRLICGSAYLQEMSEYLWAQTNMECSVGISSNKLIAKLACQLNRPKGITLIPCSSFQNVIRDRVIDISQLPGFGKSTGIRVKQRLEDANGNGLWSLNQTEEEIIIQKFGSTVGNKLFEYSRGICTQRVIGKDVNANVACSKSFNGSERAMTADDMIWHVKNLRQEMLERLLEEQTRHHRETNYLRIQVSYETQNQEAKASRIFPVPVPENRRGWEKVDALALECIRNMDIFPKKNGQLKIMKLTLQANWKNNPTVIEGLTAAICASIAVSPSKTTSRVFQLRITIDKVKPTIWRTIQVPEWYTFYELHYALLKAVGWDHSMNHEFDTGIGTVEWDSSEKMVRVVVGLRTDKNTAKFWKGIKHILDEKETPIAEYFNSVGDEVRYQHGFDDDWWHTILLDAILPATPGKTYPCCLAGKRAAPPEYDMDAFGFKELMEPEELKDAQEKGFYVNYDPDKFDPDKVFFSDVEISSDEENE